MSRLQLCLLFFLYIAPATSEEHWILGEWASNFDDTFRVNRYYSNQGEEGVAALKGVHDSVQMRWSISVDHLKVSDLNGSVTIEKIDLKPMADGTYQIDMGPTSLTVLKTHDGMCSISTMVSTGILDNRTLECFRRPGDI